MPVTAASAAYRILFKLSVCPMSQHSAAVKLFSY